MKKILALILALVICLGLCACGDKSEIAGLYKQTSCESFILPTFSDALYIPALEETTGRLVCERYFKLNKDGSGISYLEIAEDNPKITEKTKQEELEKHKKEFTWDFEDGYLIIDYGGGSAATYEKKGAHYISILNEDYMITKVS